MIQLIFRLTYLECILSGKRSGDRIYLTYRGKKIWPSGKKYIGMDDNNASMTDIELEAIRPGEHIILELWNFKPILKDRFLGRFIIWVDESEGLFRSDMHGYDRKKRHPKYSIGFEITRRLQRKSA